MSMVLHSFLVMFAARVLCILFYLYNFVFVLFWRVFTSCANDINQDSGNWVGIDA